MTKWYDKRFEVITEKNFIPFFLFLFAIFLFVIQKIGDNETVRLFSFLTFSMGVGEYIGEKLGKKYDTIPNFIGLPALAIFIICFIFQICIIAIDFLIAIICGIFAGFYIYKAKKGV